MTTFTQPYVDSELQQELPEDLETAYKKAVKDLNISKAYCSVLEELLSAKNALIANQDLIIANQDLTIAQLNK